MVVNLLIVNFSGDTQLNWVTKVQGVNDACKEAVCLQSYREKREEPFSADHLGRASRLLCLKRLRLLCLPELQSALWTSWRGAVVWEERCLRLGPQDSLLLVPAHSSVSSTRRGLFLIDLQASRAHYWPLTADQEGALPGLQASRPPTAFSESLAQGPIACTLAINSVEQLFSANLVNFCAFC